MLVNNDSKIYVGQNEIIKAYQGTNVVYEKQTLPEKYYFIQNGVINMENTNGFDKQNQAGGTPLVVNQNADSISISVAEWGNNWWFTRKTIPFAHYTNLYIEMSHPALGSYSHMYIRNTQIDSDIYNIIDLTANKRVMPKQVVTVPLPNPIPDTMDKLYFSIMNTVRQIYIYNMWLE